MHEDRSPGSDIRADEGEAAPRVESSQRVESGSTTTTSDGTAHANPSDDGATHRSRHIPGRRWRQRLRRRIRRNRTLDTTWRIGVFVVGVLFVVAGLIMFVAPGPGWLTIILGLAILATEFAWAHRILQWTKQKAHEASAKALDPRVRKRNLLVGAAVVTILVAAGWWWVASFGWPQPLLSTVDWVRSLR